MKLKELLEVVEEIAPIEVQHCQYPVYHGSKMRMEEELDNELLEMYLDTDVALVEGALGKNGCPFLHIVLEDDDWDELPEED